MSVQMRTVFSMLLEVFCTHASTASSAALSFSSDPVKALPFVLIVSITEGLFAGPCVIATAKPPSFDLPVAELSVHIDKAPKLELHNPSC